MAKTAPSVGETSHGIPVFAWLAHAALPVLLVDSQPIIEAEKVLVLATPHGCLRLLKVQSARKIYLYIVYDYNIMCIYNGSVYIYNIMYRIDNPNSVVRKIIIYVHILDQLSYIYIHIHISIHGYV